MKNPLNKVKYSFTEEEERKSKFPEYYLKEDESLMIREAFRYADKMFRNLSTRKSKILIVATSEFILRKVEKYAEKNKKPYILLKKRGDIEVVRKADRTNKYVLAGIDYVGGLEFDCVIIIGVDKGRVPPTFSTENFESYHFLNYAWHNRMYVAITRAKYSVILLGEKSSGVCRLFENAIEKEMIQFG